MKVPAVSILLLLLLTSKLPAQSPVHELKELSFLTGKWVTKNEWGEMEEHWSTPMGNSMMCAYRCVKGGKVVFYEFIVIEQEATGPVMKLRHFSPGNIGWEEKDKPYLYPLTFIESDRARFERPDKKTALTFHRLSSDKLNVILERQDKDGKWVEDVFNYTLDKL
jgi:hypothetical protein